VSDSRFNKKNEYLKTRWTPQYTQLQRMALVYRVLDVGLTILIITTGVGAVLTLPLGATPPLGLLGVLLTSLMVSRIYDLNGRARQHERIVEALQHEREQMEVETRTPQRSVTTQERTIERFVRRSEALFMQGLYRDMILMIEPDAERDAQDDDSPTEGNGLEFGSLRSRFGSNPPPRTPFSAARPDSPNEEKSPPPRPNPFSGSRPTTGAGASPFGSRTPSSGNSENPFSRSPSASPFSRPNSPFGSNSPAFTSRPMFSSGGVRGGQDDPALGGLGDHGNTGVRFTIYYPKEIAPDTWHPLKAYAYLGYALDAVIADAENGDPDKLPEILYDRNRNPRYRIPEGAQVIVTPYMKGFQFNPQSVSIGFFRPWHRFDFEMRATDAHLEEATNGILTFMVEGLVVADVPLSVYVERGLSKRQQEAIRRVTRKPYRTVYASLANNDAHLAERLRVLCDALGMYNVRDMLQLRAEGAWNESLLKAIEEAEVFQLFWSESAAQSETVMRELDSARQRAAQVENFIRAVYWEHPQTSLPNDLVNIQTAYLPDLAGLS
jgi:hypothetical protein